MWTTAKCSSDVAEEMGFTAIHHVSLESTREKFQKLGLAVK